MTNNNNNNYNYNNCHAESQAVRWTRHTNMHKDTTKLSNLWLL